MGRQTGPGRPSKLTDHQRAEIGRRLAQGESMGTLAKEYRVGKTTLSRLFSGRAEIIQKTATVIATAEMEMERMPFSEQVSVRTLADQLKGMQADYISGASKGLQTAKRLQDLAVQKAQQLDPDTVATEDLRLVAALTDTANKAAAMGTNILNANKDTAKDITVAEPKNVTVKLIRGSGD